MIVYGLCMRLCQGRKRDVLNENVIGKMSMSNPVNLLENRWI